MTDLTKLSDEDLLALRDNDYSKLSDEALVALRDSETDTIDEDSLRERMGASNERLAESKAEGASSDDLLNQAKGEIIANTANELGLGELGAVAMGAASDVFGSDMGAALQTSKDILSGVTNTSASEISEQYSKNRSEYRAVEQAFEAQNPWSFTGGQIGAGMYASALSPLRGAKETFAFGAMAGLSRSDRETVGQAITDTAAGGTTAFLFEKLGLFAKGGYDKLASKIRSGATGTLSEGVLNPTGAKKYTKLIREHVKKAYGDSPDSMRQFSDEIVDDLKIGKWDTPEDLLEAAQEARASISKGIGSVIDDMDSALGGDKYIDGATLAGRLKQRSGIVSMLNSKYESVRAAGRELSNYIDEYTLDVKTKSFTENIKFKNPDYQVAGEVVESIKSVPRMESEKLSKKMSLKDVHNLKRHLGEQIEHTFHKDMMQGEGVKAASKMSTIVKSKQRVLGALSDMMRDNVDDASRKLGLPSAPEEFITLNRKFSNIATIEPMLADAGNEFTEGFNHKVARQLLSFPGLVAGGTLAASIGGGPGLATAGLAFAGAFNQIIRDPGLPATVGLGLKRVADFMEKYPNHRIVKDLSFSMGISADAVSEKISSVIAEVDFISNAQARDMSIMQRQDSFGTILREKIGDDAADTWHKVAESGDEDQVGEFMDTIARQLPSDLIQGGIGWNGKVYSEQDKALLETELKSNSDISFAQKLTHLEGLRTQGIIPQVQPDPRPPLEHIPRRKDRHNY